DEPNTDALHNTRHSHGVAHETIRPAHHQSACRIKGKRSTVACHSHRNCRVHAKPAREHQKHPSKPRHPGGSVDMHSGVVLEPHDSEWYGGKKHAPKHDEL